MNITITNGESSITLYGNGKGIYHIISVEGLGLPTRKSNAVTYFGIDGKRTLSSQFEGRIITIGFSMFVNSQRMRNDIPDLIRILSGTGKALIESNGKKRYVEFQNASLNFGNQNNVMIQAAIQLDCDSPYFYNDVKSDIYCITKNLTTESEFDNEGFIFSSTAGSTGTGKNNGDVWCEPVIYISGSSEDEYFYITNYTTNQQLRLNYKIPDNQIVTIDIPQRKIYQLDGNNLVNYLDTNSRLADFYLARGENSIAVSGGYSIQLEYRTRYLEAL